MFILAFLVIISPSLNGIKWLSNYMHHFIAFFLLTGFVGVVYSHRGTILTSFGLCALLCVQMKNETDIPFAPVKNNLAKVRFKVALINLADVTDEASMVDVISKEDFDLVSFVEVTPDWNDALITGLKLKYPNYRLTPSVDFYGKAMFSKYPISCIDTIDNVHCKDYRYSLNFARKTISLTLTYLTPSLNKTSDSLAKVQVDNIAKLLKEDDSSDQLVLGEYNMVHWSPLIKSFKSATRLNNCRRDILPASFDVTGEQIFHSRFLTCYGTESIQLKDGASIGMMADYATNQSIEHLNEQ